MQETRTDEELKSGARLIDDIEASEPGNAERLMIHSKGRVRWVIDWGTWMVYDNGRWVMDPHGVMVMEWAKKVPQVLHFMANKMYPDEDTMATPSDSRTADQARQYTWWKLHNDWANKSNTEAQLSKMVKLARGLPGLRIESAELDARPYLLNLQNGTLNINACTFSDHDPGDLLTKMAPVMYDPSATCPVWDRCLVQWQPNGDVREFLQRICGSAIIGEPVQNLFVNLGEGANGKGTFYKRIQNVIGPYAQTAPETMLIKTVQKAHEEQYARLRGARMVLAPETDANDRLDESSIKNLTGGDLINARHLYGKPFEFAPTHTAFMHTNHAPRVHGTDVGIWRRVVLIPWETFIKAEDRDSAIDAKLTLEHSGILNWLLIGAFAWQKRGLDLPVTIRAASNQYRLDQDHAGRFLDDAYNGGFVETTASTLRVTYTAWCEAEGIRPWSAQALGKELLHKGYTAKVVRKGKTVTRCWFGPLSHNASDQGEPSFVAYVTTDSHFLPHREKSEENNEYRGSNRESSETTQLHYTEPTEEEIEEANRQWIIDRGYPAPPTDEEIEEYMNRTED